MEGIAFTIALVLITVLVSIAAFNDQRLTNKLILWPAVMKQPSEYYRFLSSGFIHADWVHLGFNMFTLFFIGKVVEQYFVAYGLTPWLFVLMYLVGIIAASMPSYFKNQHNHYYRSLGASGGVAAVLFSLVYFAPWESIYIYFIKLPNIVFAVLYLIYSAYMSKKGDSNINHDAHFWGAVFGFLFTLIVEPSHGRVFLYEIQQIRF
ncbi:MAG: rhomboid family intramembrane serine protease [Bacteroidetes bacterium]|nr:rhomboid family intramembrane serine protease [Bacteroidota bacterium]